MPVSMLRHRRARYLSTAEAAQLLGVTTKTVERWCRRELLSVREGRRPYQILRSSVERLKATRERG